MTNSGCNALGTPAMHEVEKPGGLPAILSAIYWIFQYQIKGNWVTTHLLFHRDFTRQLTKFRDEKQNENLHFRVLTLKHWLSCGISPFFNHRKGIFFLSEIVQCINYCFCSMMFTTVNALRSYGKGTTVKALRSYGKCIPGTLCFCWKMIPL